MERIADLLTNSPLKVSSIQNAPIQGKFPNSNSKQASATEFEKSAAPDSEGAETVWKNVSGRLASKLDPQIFSAWLKPLQIEGISGSSSVGSSQLDSLTVTLLAPNKFCREHVQRNYLELLVAGFSHDLRCPVLIEIKSAPLMAATSAKSSQKSSSGSPLAFRASVVGTKDGSRGTKLRASPESATAEPTSQKARTSSEFNLNPKYNFSNFVVGTCNQLAHAAGLSVSENLGGSYNPLFIYGGVGLGKTHLANAVGNASWRRDKRVLLVSSETFVSELIASLRNKRMDQFRARFRSLDLLIVDDIQFIIGKECTQEEFFHTFNELYNNQKQIVITSDRLPQELTGLEERLKTRFASGLSVDLQAPDFETRVAILVRKAESGGVVLPEEVARVLAGAVDTNVRELEGALNRLVALSSVQGVPLTADLADSVLRAIPKSRSRVVTSEGVQQAVAQNYNVSVNDITGKRRTQNIAHARQVAMYLCRKLTGFSYPEIGAFFGGRDHSTVIHAFRTICDRMNADAGFAARVDGLERQLRN